ncbi:MAG: lytic transglycosylase domain-containing protein [Caulobacteraceae bacterium]
MTLLAAALLAASAQSAMARPTLEDAFVPRAGASAIASAIVEASRRFDISERWIWTVMRLESGFDRLATSPIGAMGLMQLMPATWADMRADLGLGPDPYDAHDNILAGAAYMRWLYDRFGAEGFLAAYNAGPARYLEFLTHRRALPPETLRYVAAAWSASRAGANAPLSISRRRSNLAPAESLFAQLHGSQNPPGIGLVSALPDAAAAATPARTSGSNTLFASSWRPAAP